MFEIGEKIIYGENGVCTVEKIAPLEMSGASREKLYYHLTPLVGSGTYFAPVDTNAYMRRIISRSEAEALIDAIPGIEPACEKERSLHIFNYAPVKSNPVACARISSLNAASSSGILRPNPPP